MLLIFYLAEYLHLVISAVHFTIFFIGGWWSLQSASLVLPIFLTPHDTLVWGEIFNSNFGVFTFLPF
jgi:NADH:ubiquinone oxidoreductase subunit H